jgi:hypothetical protein
MELDLMAQLIAMFCHCGLFQLKKKCKENEGHLRSTSTNIHHESPKMTREEYVKTKGRLELDG